MRGRRALTNENPEHQAARDGLFQSFDFCYPNSYRESIVLADHHIRCGGTALLRAIDNLLGDVFERVRHFELFLGTADRNFSNLDCRKADADRNCLSLLTANTNSLIEF